jgi:hypothetical protein
VKRVLSFLNLLDNGGNLSITNIAVYIALFKLASSAQLSGCDVAGLLGVLGNYCHKRYVSDGASQ